MAFPAVDPLNAIVHDICTNNKYYEWKEDPRDARSCALWKSKSVKEYQEYFKSDLQQGTSSTNNFIANNYELGAHLLLINIWSDEYTQFAFLKRQYRLIILRVVNSKIYNRYIIGTYPAGTLFTIEFNFKSF